MRPPEGGQNRKKGGRVLPFCPQGDSEGLSNRRAARACTRAGSIHADYAGLIGVIHVLSGCGRSDGHSRNRIRLIGRTRGERKRVAALLAG